MEVDNDSQDKSAFKNKLNSNTRNMEHTHYHTKTLSVKHDNLLYVNALQVKKSDSEHSFSPEHI